MDTRSAVQLAHYLARLANLLTVQYILPTFFFMFYIFNANFLTLVSQNPLDRSSPKFKDW